MGLNVFLFAIVPALLAFGLIARSRGGGSGAAQVAALLSLLLAASAFAKGLSYIYAESSTAFPLALTLERASGAALFAAHAALLLLVFHFPAPAPLLARRLALAVLVALVAYVGFRIAFTIDYMRTLRRMGMVFVRVKGYYFDLATTGQAILGFAACAALTARAFSSKERIQRLRVALALVGVIPSLLATWWLSSADLTTLPSGNIFLIVPITAYYTLVPIAFLVMGAVVDYAVNVTRILDWKALGGRLLAYAALLVVAGIPSGIAVAALSSLRRFSVLIPLIGVPLVFAGTYIAARRFAGGFFERLTGRSEYREQLESELSHIDLSLGRDAVLGELYRLLSGALDFTDFALLVEDDRGALKTAYAPTGAKTAIERGSVLAKALEEASASVILKSEAQASSAYEAVRAELLGLFDKLKAEALILVREGRRVIGVFALGPRRTGADYTAYDYETFRAIYGKLFVFAYYLKNVARESILHMVDRELALSDQVIRFALENIDPIKHEKTDTAWVMKSTRNLGGDFIDFVRLSQDRWFFVMGDVSGKGLSASMNMLILKSMIRTFLRVEKDFVGLVVRVNAFIKDNLPRGTFFAGVFGYFDLAKDSFYYINCGVPAMLLYSPSFDTFIEVQGEGRVLGF
ncbi:MAG: PP2C family serine/threonine-protein phosphatase, partial [Spirochaetaceae bacterium]|nr:PP2C family serine/threonine-protein phosphatase [Spirochaetaceae bacterium]